uniref:uncharacterized protein LOC105352390 isoform X2 n=1 Tax=Fragaria vesca subsp. vesca TaxID=101020 RepID=UPI0005CA0121|nr:PREDICTED: uncharacterized protein LOC105352390 isoform X2 [Fragaria vesca subsp. vesca]
MMEKELNRLCGVSQGYDKDPKIMVSAVISIWFRSIGCPVIFIWFESVRSSVISKSSQTPVYIVFDGKKEERFGLHMLNSVTYFFQTVLPILKVVRISS